MAAPPTTVAERLGGSLKPESTVGATAILEPLTPKHPCK